MKNQITAIIFSLLPLCMLAQTPQPTGVYEPHTFKYHYFPHYVRIGNTLVMDNGDTAGLKLIAPGLKFFNNRPHYYDYTAGRWYTLLRTTDTAGLSGGDGGTASSGINKVGNDFRLGSTTALSQYTPIVVDSYPLSILKNGLNYSARSDSSSIRLNNNTSSTSSTDSLVSPMLIFSTNGRKISAGGASQNVSFRMFSYGTSGSGSASANFRIESLLGVVGQTPVRLIEFNRSGTILHRLNINGTYVGSNLGGNNIIVGSSSTFGSGNASGSGNVAVGTDALLTQTTADYNTAVGYNALVLNTTGFYNTSVGSFSLSKNTTGEQNAAFGVNALRDNLKGYKNSAFGTAALESLWDTTGEQYSSFNTAIGHDAAYQMTKGSYNSFLGWLSGSGLLEANRNVAIGESSMRTVLYGNRNTAIGNQAMYGSGQATTIYNSIALGADVRVQESYNMTLGNDSLQKTRIRGGIYTTDTTGITLWGQRNTDSAMVRLPSGLWGGGGGGTTLYSGNGSLASGRTVSGAGNALTFDSLGNYFVYVKPTGYTSKAWMKIIGDFSDAENGVNMFSTAEDYADTAYLKVGTNSIIFKKAAGSEYQFKNLSSTIDTTTYKFIVSDANGNLRRANSVAQFGGGGSSSLSSLTAASTSNTIDNSGNQQTWDWNSLTTQVGGLRLRTNSVTSGSLFRLTSTSTAATGNTQNVLEVNTSGANSNSTQTTYAATITNTHTGTSSTNVGLMVSASGGNTNNAIDATGDFKLNGRMYVGNTTGMTDASGANQGSYWKMTDNYLGGITFANAANNSTLLSIGANGIQSNQPIQFTSTSSGFKFNSSSGGSFFGGTSTASAKVHIAAGTTSASSASLKINEGTRMSTAEDGAIEKDDAFYATKTNAVRYGIGGSLNTNYTTVGNVGAGEDNLQTYTIPAGTLSQDGDYIEFTMSFSVAVNSTLKVYFGATQLFSFAALATDGVYRVTGQVVRTGATTQRATFIMNGGAVQTVVGYQTPTETLSGTVVLKATGEGASNNDITQTLTMVKFFPAN